MSERITVGNYKLEKKLNKLSKDDFRLNTNMSIKAKGILFFLLSDKDFIPSIKNLERYFSDGNSSISNSLKELEENNYLIREKIEGGSVSDLKYIVSSKPISN